MGVLESLQKRAARFVSGNYYYETGIIIRRIDSRLILLYKGLKGKASVVTDYLIHKLRVVEMGHSLVF